MFGGAGKESTRTKLQICAHSHGQEVKVERGGKTNFVSFRVMWRGPAGCNFHIGAKFWTSTCPSDIVVLAEARSRRSGFMKAHPTMHLVQGEAVFEAACRREHAYVTQLLASSTFFRLFVPCNEPRPTPFRPVCQEDLARGSGWASRHPHRLHFDSQLHQFLESLRTGRRGRGDNALNSCIATAGP